jgi:hypothetical protein
MSDTGNESLYFLHKMTVVVNGCVGQIVAMQSYFLYHNGAEMVTFLMLTLQALFTTLSATNRMF